MVAMTSKFNFECVIQYYTDQWVQAYKIIFYLAGYFCLLDLFYWVFVLILMPNCLSSLTSTPILQ